MAKKETKTQESEWPKGMGRPAQAALAHVGITRMAQLTKYTRAEILKLHGVGPKGLSVLESAMKAKGLAFKAEKK